MPTDFHKRNSGLSYDGIYFFPFARWLSGAVVPGQCRDALHQQLHRVRHAGTGSMLRVPGIAELCLKRRPKQNKCQAWVCCSHISKIYICLEYFQLDTFLVTETEQKLSHIIRDRARPDSVPYFLAAKGPHFKTHLGDYGKDEVFADFISRKACHVL